MEYLLASLPAVFRSLQNSSHFLLCSDYDGTLTPIVDRPEWAVLPEEVKETIRALHRSPFFTIAIISGRSLSDIQSHVGIRDLYYVGNHGLEILHPGGRFVSLTPPESQRALDSLRTEFRDQVSALRGVHLEDKGAILAFHYRRASLRTQVALRRSLLKVKAKYFNVLELTFGKMVMEVRPRCPVNKGTALNYLREEVGRQAFPIYIGDDLTDADAFRVIKGKGLAIQVGQSRLPIMGDYSLRDPGEVSLFLRGLLNDFLEKNPAFI